MKRTSKKVATDRRFVVALSRGLDVLRAFRPNDGLLGNQEIAARTNLPKPTVSRLTYTLTKLGYLTPVPRFEKYQLAPSAMALGYAALANLGVRHLSEPFREALMRETGGAVAVGARDRHSMIYFGQSRNGLTLNVQLDVGSRVPIATSAMGRAYVWALPDDERAALLRDLREHYGSRWPKLREGIERSGEIVAKHGFAISAGEWQDDVHAVGVALKLNDGTGPYAFNCGAPAFRFTEERLLTDIGPRLLAMVRNIEAALGGVPQARPGDKTLGGKTLGGKTLGGKTLGDKTLGDKTLGNMILGNTPQSKKEPSKKLKSGGKVARVAEGIR
jgi:DNA-binding IclR family transcriptional regulator